MATVAEIQAGYEAAIAALTAAVNQLIADVAEIKALVAPASPVQKVQE
jgi:hypothetical protein